MCSYDASFFSNGVTKQSQHLIHCFYSKFILKLVSTVGSLVIYNLITEESNCKPHKIYYPKFKLNVLSTKLPFSWIPKVFSQLNFPLVGSQK